jgi:hypothetical protein
MDKIEAAIRMLEKDGHSIQRQLANGKVWFEIDRRMRATPDEMQNLADGVYSLTELEELFIQRRVENTDADELAEGLITEWGRYAEAGHAKDLSADFKDVAERAFDLRSATQLLDNQRRNFEMIAEHTGKPVSDDALEQPLARHQAAREKFLSTYRVFLNKQRISRASN